MPPINVKQTPIPEQEVAVEPFTPRDFREAMGRFASGVVVITTQQGDDAHAMTATAFMSGSLQPPLIVVSVDANARMHEKILASGHFGVSLLAQEQQDASNCFAGRVVEGYVPEFERLAGVPVLAGATVQLAADLRNSYPCGDHTLFVGEIQKLVLAGNNPSPLVYHSGGYASLNSTDG